MNSPSSFPPVQREGIFSRWRDIEPSERFQLEGFESHAQFGEDAYVHTQFASDFQGFACDVGASNGRTLSNTWTFEQAGWNVLCIEANPLYTEILKLNRRNVLMVACGAEFGDDIPFYAYELNPGNWEPVSSLNPDAKTLDDHKHLIERSYTFKVPVRTLDWCLEQASFPRLDYLSIDVEGTELDVLKGFDIHRWNPKVVVIECWKPDAPAANFMLSSGYERATRLGVNEIFVRRDDPPTRENEMAA